MCYLLFIFKNTLTIRLLQIKTMKKRNKIDITNITDITDIMEILPDQLTIWLQEHGIASYRTGQIMRWIYQRQADSFDIMTDISKEDQLTLSDYFIITRLERVRIEKSEDGTRKYLFRLTDGSHIESVLIPEKGYYTLCISSQVGCAQGCGFCLTAKGGFIRNLSMAEITGQVRDIQNDIQGTIPLTNIVLMGMGEPLANYENVMNSINVITDVERGLGFTGRRVTLSTAGILPKLNKLSDGTSINLAISLNAVDNKTRDRLMPINKIYPIEKLIETCGRIKMKPRQRITFEYILIKGVNDSENDALKLVKLLSNVKSKINLIPFNSHEGCEFAAPEERVISRFQKILVDKNFTVMVRRSKGRDISAACGQLRARVEKSVI